MLEEHSNKDMLLAETVREVLIEASHDSIPKYIESGLKQLNKSADEYIEMIDWNKEKWCMIDRYNIIKMLFY